MYGNGYDGYSMSNNARAAYDNDEKPFSRWTKEDLLEQVDYVLEDTTPQFDRKKLEKLPVAVLRDILLSMSSWHHTGKYYNVTDFYEVSPSYVEELTDEKMDSALQYYREKKKEAAEIKSYRGSISYLVWSGTRAHPKAKEERLDDVLIEEHGCFYVVKNEDGKEILRKKMDSRGTCVTKYEKEKRLND